MLPVKLYDAYSRCTCSHTKAHHAAGEPWPCRIRACDCEGFLYKARKVTREVTLKDPRLLVAAALAIPVVLAGCMSSSSEVQAIASARSSMTANPAYQASKAKAEQELLVAFKADFDPAHPVTSTMTAVRGTFPNGSTTKIVNFAVRTFTLADSHPGAKQQAWIAGVATYALDNGAITGVSGQPSIPGVTATATP